MTGEGFLDALQHVVGQAARKAGAIGLLEDLLDDQVIDDERVTLGANTAQRRDVLVHLDRLGELGQRVSQDSDLSVSSAFLAPGASDEGVVDGHAGNNIVALGSNLVDVLDEAWQVGLKEPNHYSLASRDQS